MKWLPTWREKSAPEHFSESAFWNKAGSILKKVGHKVLFLALTLFYCLQDKDTPKWAKGVICGTLGYLILPMDLIPDVIPGIGFSDDWGSMLAALGIVAAYIKTEHKTKAREQLEAWFGKKVVDAEVIDDFIE